MVEMNSSMSYNSNFQDLGLFLNVVTLVTARLSFIS